MILFPPPHNVCDRGRLLDFSGLRWLILPPQAGFELKEAARRTATLLATGFLVPPAVTAGIPGAGGNLLRMVRNPALPQEAYRLDGRGIFLWTSVFSSTARETVTGAGDPHRGCS